MKVTRSAAPKPTFEGRVQKPRSGSTLSKPQHLSGGVEELTKCNSSINYNGYHDHFQSFKRSFDKSEGMKFEIDDRKNQDDNKCRKGKGGGGLKEGLFIFPRGEIFSVLFCRDGRGLIVSFLCRFSSNRSG
jgi:hypothetical protein